MPVFHEIWRCLNYSFFATLLSLSVYLSLTLFWFFLFLSLYLSLCASGHAMYISVPLCDLFSKILWPCVYNSDNDLEFRVFSITPRVQEMKCGTWTLVSKYVRRKLYHRITQHHLCVCRVCNNLHFLHHYHYHYRWRGVVTSSLMEKQCDWDKAFAVWGIYTRRVLAKLQQNKRRAIWKIIKDADCSSFALQLDRLYRLGWR